MDVAVVDMGHEVGAGEVLGPTHGEDATPEALGDNPLLVGHRRRDEDGVGYCRDNISDSDNVKPINLPFRQVMQKVCGGRIARHAFEHASHNQWLPGASVLAFTVPSSCLSVLAWIIRAPTRVSREHWVHFLQKTRKKRNREY